MAVFGQITGPIYCLGFIQVPTPGTPVALSANVSTQTAFGTPTTGIPGLTTSGTPAQMCANQIILKAPSTNTNVVYLVYKGASKAIPNGIIVDLTAGQTIILGSSAGHSPYQLLQLQVDAEIANEGLRVTAIIV